MNFTADAVIRNVKWLTRTMTYDSGAKTMLLSLKEPKLTTIASELIGNRVIVRTQAGADSSPVTSVEPPPATARA